MIDLFGASANIAVYLGLVGQQLHGVTCVAGSVKAEHTKWIVVTGFDQGVQVIGCG